MDALNNLSILCVEDDAFALEEMIVFLKKRAGKVFAAENGTEGIRQYEIHKPDIIIADLLMPGMDGMEMLKQIKSADPKVHAIVVTSVKALETVLESIDLGVDNYIVKPVEFDELEKKLGKLAEKIISGRGGYDPFGANKNRRALEDTIKKEFIKQIKLYLGKGPKEIIVQLIGKELKITVMDAFTIMEENMMKITKHHEMIRLNRSVAYEDICGKFRLYLTELLGTEVSYDKAEIDLKKKFDKIRFTI